MKQNKERKKVNEKQTNDRQNNRKNTTVTGVLFAE